MLRISKIADYGIVLTTRMARVAGGHPRAVRDLAAETGIPQPTASKVLKGLARQGLVESHRGAHGGYRLARTAEQISVADVISALEGPIAVTECTSSVESGQCDHEGVCEVQVSWQQINAAVRGALASVTLADMAHDDGTTLVPIARSAEEAERLRSRNATSTALGPSDEGQPGALSGAST
jgi:FeS assembly SUF system regulator